MTYRSEGQDLHTNPTQTPMHHICFFIMPIMSTIRFLIYGKMDWLDRVSRPVSNTRYPCIWTRGETTKLTDTLLSVISQSLRNEWTITEAIKPYMERIHGTKLIPS